ncbi:MAG: zf-HC2 domain-containing protein, partial [Planctomycetota bacterium]
MDGTEIHGKIDDWIAAQDAGGLSPEEQGALREHVAQCKECREVLRESRQVAEVVGTALSGDRPGADFEENMVSAFRERADASSFRVAKPAPAARKVIVSLGGVAALVALVIGVGFLLSANGLDSQAPQSGTGRSNNVGSGP